MLRTLKQHLIELEYPNINAMNDELVADLFEVEHVHVYLKWFVGKLICGMETPGNSDVNILKAFGFAVPELQPFAITTSAINHQMKIFLSMLEKLKIILNETNTETESTLDASNPDRHLDLETIVRTNIDLFPSIPGRKRYTAAQRCKRMETLHVDLIDLEQEIKRLEIELEHESVPLASVCEGIAPNNGNVINEINKFSMCASKLVETRANQTNNVVAPRFSDKFPEKLQELHGKVHEVEKYFNCLDTFQRFNNLTTNANLHLLMEQTMFIKKMLTNFREL